MPNVDVLRIALIVLLVGALVAVAAWFVGEIAPTIVSSGQTATEALSGEPATAWASVVSLFGTGWAKTWEFALGVVLLLGTVFLTLRLIKWVQ